MHKYGSYISSSLLFTALLMIFLLYWTFHYKSKVKSLEEELNVRNEAFKTIQGRMQKSEVITIQNEHSLEKQILELKQDIKTLDDSLKEGLKSQVVSKIEEYQSKRIKHLSRVDIEV